MLASVSLQLHVLWDKTRQRNDRKMVQIYTLLFLRVVQKRQLREVGNNASIQNISRIFNHFLKSENADQATADGREGCFWLTVYVCIVCMYCMYVLHCLFVFMHFIFKHPSCLPLFTLNDYSILDGCQCKRLVIVMALDSRTRSRGFKSRPSHLHIMTLSKLFTHTCASVNNIIWYWRWHSSTGKATAGLMESNVSLSPSSWLVTCGWLPRDRDQLRTQNSCWVWHYLFTFLLLILIRP